MTRDELLEQFWEAAQYCPRNIKGDYRVRVGREMLFDSDTQMLFEKYVKAVKRLKSQV